MGTIKAKNPVFVVDDRATIEAAINTGAATKNLTFDEVRAALSKTPEALPDGTIHQIALDLGFKVDN